MDYRDEPVEGEQEHVDAALEWMGYKKPLTFSDFDGDFWEATGAMMGLMLSGGKITRTGLRDVLRIVKREKERPCPGKYW